MDYIFGVDIGGTTIKIGKFYNGKMVDNYVLDTNVDQHGEHIIPEICQFIDKTVNQQKDNIIGIGIAVPGPVVGGMVLGAHNIGWGEIDVKTKVLSYFPKAIVSLLNDANAATVGESMHLDNCRNVVMLTLGTGIGAGIIVDGELAIGANGSAGEAGHMKIVADNGRKCSCGLTGCFEQYASATGIVTTALEYRQGKKTLLNKSDLTCKDIFDYAKYGDNVSQKVVDRYCYELAIGCANLANIINPDVIILGGGVSKAGNYLLDKVRSYFYDLAFYSVRNTSIKLASLGSDAGMYGCYYAVRKELDI